MGNGVQTHVENLNTVAELRDGIEQFCTQLRHQVDSLNDALYSLSSSYQDEGYDILCSKMQVLDSKLTDMEEKGRIFNYRLEEKIQNIVKQMQIAAAQGDF